MFTLQILDRGQTFLHALDNAPLILGVGEEADVRLRETGVVPSHARIEPVADGVRLFAKGRVLVNGQVVQSTLLALGDRIEIGKAVLVVGRSVSRAAGPEDVLADALPRARTNRARATHTGAGRRARWLAIATAGLVLAGVAALALRGGDETHIQGEIANVARLRQAGQLDQASAAVERLARSWADATDDRLQRLDAERQALLAIEATALVLTEQILDPTVSRSYAQWIRELQRLEAEGTPIEQVAARRVRSSLGETMLRRPPATPGPDSVASPTPPAVGSPAAGSGLAAGSGSASGSGLATEGASLSAGPAASAAPPPATSRAASTDGRSSAESTFTEAERLVDQGLFTQALALLEAELANADGASTLAVVRHRIDAVRQQAQRALVVVLEQSGRAVLADKPVEAVQMLTAARHHFPATVEFAALGAELVRAEALAAAAARKASAPTRPDAADESVRLATFASLRSHMDQVRTAEERAAFGEAARLLRQGADLVRSKDADFARRLEGRAAEADLLAAWHDSVAQALTSGRSLATTSAAGQSLQLRAVDGAALVAASFDGDVRVSWHEVGSVGLVALAEQCQPTGKAMLGVATLLYKQGENERAEALLAKALRADGTLKAPIDAVVARGRGEPPDPLGYTLGKDGFVSARSIEVQKQAQKLAGRLDAVLRDKNPAAREAFVTDVLASGPDALAIMVAAFQREFVRQVQKLESGTLKKQVDRLAQQRVMLDAARKQARDLIYDEVKYFYPYRPPAVSGKRYAEYIEVQAEVDRRVAALRTLWRDDRISVRVPGTLRADLDRLDWVAKVLGDLGELDQASLAGVDWARALPAGDSVGIRDYCASLAERNELEEWRRIETYDGIVVKQLSSAVREQLRVTNDYRAMFRHRPLAAVRTICEAAQGHAAEMSRLGYFDHMSPTPGRKTPYDRMRLAGYKFGVSENIALADGAQGSHTSWCQSSGHHRNLLNPSHHEVGIGADGRYWVQNFGSGTVYRDDPAWATACEVGRR